MPGWPLSVHVCSPRASGEWLEITRSSRLPRPDSPARQISSNNPGSSEWILPPTCHLSPSNVVTQPCSQNLSLSSS